MKYSINSYEKDLKNNTVDKEKINDLLKTLRSNMHDENLQCMNNCVISDLNNLENLISMGTSYENYICDIYSYSRDEYIPFGLSTNEYALPYLLKQLYIYIYKLIYLNDTPIIYMDYVFNSYIQLKGIYHYNKSLISEQILYTYNTISTEIVNIENNINTVKRDDNLHSLGILFNDTYVQEILEKNILKNTI